ncbi:MAG: AsmA family protein, partial [Myxococcales bacterium]|nr:AsmA family protein [Myxococcales bacterium]
MKKPVKTTLIAIGASLLLLLAALALVPFLLKDRVVELVRRQVNEQLEATVDFEDVELSLLSTFPALTIEVVGLEVAGAGEYEGVTLASVQSLRAGVDLRRLVRDDQLLIESATVDQPEIYLIVNEDGEANYDIVKAADEEEETEAEDEPGALRLRLQQFQVTRGRIEYDAPGAEVSLEGFEHQGSAFVDGATYTVSSTTTVESLTVRIGNVRYIRKAKARFDLSAVLHADDERLDVERLEVALNELTGEAKGTIEWRDGQLDLDLGL